MNSGDDQILDRLARLERQNRRLRASMACLFGLAVAAAAAAYATASAPAALAGAASQPAPAAAGSIQAHEFRLLDRGDRMRALLNMSREDAPQLLFFDKRGKITLSLPPRTRIIPAE